MASQDQTRGMDSSAEQAEGVRDSEIDVPDDGAVSNAKERTHVRDQHHRAVIHAETPPQLGPAVSVSRESMGQNDCLFSGLPHL